MPPSPKVPGGVGGALGGLILDHLINPPPVSPAGLDQIDPGLLYPAPPPQAIDPGKAQLWDGGQDPNTYYKIKYQTANISSGTLVGWSGDKYTSPSELKGTISSAQLLINNVPYSSAASDTELFHWSFDGKGLDPFRNERSKNYSLKINNAEVYPISVTFGVKILGFVPTNGGIDPGGDPPPILPPITSDAGNNLAPTPLPGLSPLPTPPIVAPSPLPGTTGSNTDSNRKAGYPPSATPTTQPNTTAPSTPTNPPDALGTDTNTTPNNLAPDLPLVPPGIIAPPPTSRVPSNTPSNTPSPVTRPYVPNTGTNVNNGAQPGTDIAPRDTPDAVQTPVDRCVTDCPMPPVNLNPTDQTNQNIDNTREVLDSKLNEILDELGFEFEGDFATYTCPTAEYLQNNPGAVISDGLVTKEVNQYSGKGFEGVQTVFEKLEITLRRMQESICAERQDGDTVTIVAAPEVQGNVANKILVLDFTTVEAFPGLNETKSKWRVQIPNPIEDITWSTLRNVRWFRGSLYGQVRLQGYKSIISGWFKDKDSGENYFNQVLALTESELENMTFSLQSNPKISPAEVETRIYRAYIVTIDNQSGEPDTSLTTVIYPTE
jgi:hypothetical protein